MNLYAYANIPFLEKLLQENDIYCPRLRGLEWMGEETEPFDVEDRCKREISEVTHSLCTSVPFWTENTCCSEFSERTDRKIQKYCPDGEVQWDKIHGWKRKALKTAIHNKTKRVRKQYETYNKYLGREDILYIHARIGGGNWSFYGKDIANQPWFLEKVDDSFDNTYCDIYAKLSKPVVLEMPTDEEKPV